MNDEWWMINDSGRNPAEPDFKFEKVTENKKAPSLGEGAVTRRVTEGGVRRQARRDRRKHNYVFFAFVRRPFRCRKGVEGGWMINDEWWMINDSGRNSAVPSFNWIFYARLVGFITPFKKTILLFNWNGVRIILSHWERTHGWRPKMKC